ncbi:hypothetical protein L2U69_12020 [Zavarzinia compransoris]|uniref:hypothetical protein n=1 Tax=Zavarzinia marina TaxID=2911065 RepID=UPI001F28DEB5|nr:hypothetical protein [Zavarzinia marina]MCF4166373.1 hypothetical protein [Zavarzinia marina]
MTQDVTFIVTAEKKGRRHIHVGYPDGTKEVFSLPRSDAVRLGQALIDDSTEARRIKG